MKRVAYIDHAIGIVHQWTQCRSPSKVALRWEAEPGHTLKWTDHNHLCSIALPTCNQLGSKSIELSNLCFTQEPYLHFKGLSPRRIWLSCSDTTCHRRAFPAVCELLLVPARCAAEWRLLQRPDQMSLKLEERRLKLGKYHKRVDMDPGNTAEIEIMLRARRRLIEGGR